MCHRHLGRGADCTCSDVPPLPRGALRVRNTVKSHSKTVHHRKGPDTAVAAVANAPAAAHCARPVCPEQKEPVVGGDAESKRNHGTDERARREREACVLRAWTSMCVR